MKKRILSLILASFAVGCASQHLTPLSEAEKQAQLAEADVEDTEIGDGDTEVVQLSVPPADDGTPLTKAEQDVLGSPVVIKQEQNSTQLLDLEAELAPEDKMAVELHFKYFTHRGRKHLELYLKRLEQYYPHVKSVFERRGIPAEIGYLALVESGFNPNAVSRVGATGLWQFMPYTAKDLGLQKSWWIDERRDPYKSTEAAAEYLLWLYSRYENWYLAIAAYNAGPGKISRALDGTSSEGFFDILRKNHTLNYKTRLRLETKQYVPKFIAIVKIMRNLRSLGFQEPNFANNLDVKPVPVKPNTDLRALASRIGISWEEFKYYNPAFRRNISPDNINSVAYVPKQKISIATSYLASARPVSNNAIPKSSTSAFIAYTVKKGDTLSEIAEAHKVSVQTLKRVNRNSTILRPGQKLSIPSSRARTTYVAQRSSGKVMHQVKRGDSLYDISRKYAVPIQTIVKANNIQTNSILQQGQSLLIPSAKRSSYPVAQVLAPVTYKVRRGDTIWGIAQKFNVSVNKILQWNKMNASVTLQPGDRLQVFVR